MMNLSVFVHENDGFPHHTSIPINTTYYMYVKGAKGLRSTIVIKFSIQGASFTGIVKNARVLRYRCGITYAGTTSNCRLKYM